MKPTPDADIEKTVDDLFGLFGVDRRDPLADRELWIAMATHIFPALATRPPSRGRPKGTRRGQSLWDCVRLAERYNAFASDMRRQHPGALDRAVMKAFVRKNQDVLKPFCKGIDTPKTLSFETLNKKITIGRKYIRFVDTENMPGEVSVLREALSFAPFGTQVLLRGELANMDASSVAGKDRLLQIAKEIAAVVPARISLGPVMVNPYWKRRSAE